jgi:chorismate synthase
MSSGFGTIFRLTNFGESHGEAIGGILEGCPAGLKIDEEFIQSEMARRRPGQSTVTTARQETDRVEFMSGIFEGNTTGTPIGFIIRNTDQKSADYDQLKTAYRPSHADFTYEKKYGLRDYRGGGRSSARETATRVVAGAIAKLFLRQYGIEVQAFVKQIGHLKLTQNYDGLELSKTEESPVRCPDPGLSKKMIELIESVKAEGDSLGGVVQGVVTGMPIGLGEPVFDKLPAVLAHGLMSINAVKGFELGSGFDGVSKKGSEHNDIFMRNDEGQIRTKTNNSGGVQGGISNGMPLYFNLAFKPVATIAKQQETINNKGETTSLSGKGRHDACVLPRAVPIVEAMTAIVIADFILRARCNRLHAG